MNVIEPLQHMKRVYCAGPLFNPAERKDMELIAIVLRSAGFDTWLPHADGTEFANVRPELIRHGFSPSEAGAFAHRAIFALDIYQVVLGCGSLVFNMNGRVPDEGGVAEAAIAWTLGKPVVLYKSDVRSMVSGRDNPLIAGMTEFQIIQDVEELGLALAARIARRSEHTTWRTVLPPQLQQPVERGERFWQQLVALGEERSAANVAEIMLDVFGRGTNTDSRCSTGGFDDAPAA